MIMCKGSKNVIHKIQIIMASLCIYIIILATRHIIYLSCIRVAATDEMKSSAFAIVLSLLLLALIKVSFQQSNG